MIKIMAFIRAKPGLSRAEFRDYYETKHVPLVRSLLPGMADYRRNYLAWDDAHLLRGPRDRGVDVITEVWFEDQAAYDRFVGAFSEPSVRQRIEDDEDNFLDGKSVQILVVDESPDAR